MERKYGFVHLEKKTFNFVHDPDIKQYLRKWSLLGNLQVQSYGFNEQFCTYQKKEFVHTFLNDPVVMNTLPMRASIAQHARSVDVDDVPCSITSTSFFDQLTNPSNSIVRDDGSIRKCLDTPMDEFIISDELRKMLLDDESDHYNLYSEDDRKQFLFCILKHLCLGGKWCQYEDNIKPYLNVARSLYKDLISVQREPGTNMIYVNSIVLNIVARDEKDAAFFPSNPENVQNFVYLIINSFSRHLTVLSHDYNGVLSF